MDTFRDVWILRGKYVAFVLTGSHFNGRPPLACQNRSSVGRRNQARRENEIADYNNKTPVLETGVLVTDILSCWIRRVPRRCELPIMYYRCASSASLR